MTKSFQQEPNKWKEKKMIFNVTILIRNEKIQHVVNCRTEEEMRERIRRAYKGQAVIYRIEEPGKSRRTEIWNEDVRGN